ncbi:MAG: FtsQ-type POTRA domain-containing protein [Gemmatimonadota bacterium]|nr:FtsQ-type POTRA domain-containing protein [Gemmatimonadota bacterium]
MSSHRPIYSRTQERERIPHVEPETRSQVRILRWIVVPALGGLLLFGIQNAYSALTGSDVFRLDHISVTGNRLLKESDVAGRSGLEVGVDLFSADLAAATQRLAADPAIKHALLMRQPPGGLLIQLQERRPLALAATPEGLYGLDGDGVFFPLPQAPFDLPIVTGIEAVADTPGVYRSSGLVAFLDQLRSNAPAFLEEVSEVHLVSDAEARVFLVGDGLTLRMRLEDAVDQVLRFDAFVKAGAHRTQTPAYVDLRFSNQVIVGTGQ